MTIEEIQQRLREGLGEAAAGRLHAAAKDPWIVVPVESLQAVCLFLRDDPQLQFEMLNDLTLVDYLETDPKKKTPHEPRMELVYHLSSVTLGHRLVIKAHLPRLVEGAADAFPHVPSVTSIWAGADWHEREAFDMFGVRFQGHPNLQRILCAEDWQGHPLRKDYPFPEEYHGIRAY